MKTIEFTFGGKTLHLYLNGEAMFAIEALNDERPEGEPEILEQVLAPENTSASFSAICKVAVILAAQGENCRRYLHYSPERVPDARELLLLLTPMQMVSLRNAVYQAVSAGYGNVGEDGGGDIDTGLAELEKKTKL